MPETRKRRVTVEIKVKRTTNGDLYTLKVDPISIWIATTGEEITWVAKKCNLLVEYKKNGTPFGTIGKPQETFSVTAGNEVSSGVPLSGKAHFNYKLTVTPNPPIPQGSHPAIAPIVIDPETVIDDGGPPGGLTQAGRKAKGRKTGKKVARKSPRKSRRRVRPKGR